MSDGAAFVRAGGWYLALQRQVAGVVVKATRPNNVVAYNNTPQVWGAAGDARLQLQVPALPADAEASGFAFCLFLAVNSRGSADATLGPVNVALCRGGFTTVLGDQAAFALNDADIANLQTGGSAALFNLTFSTGLAPTTLVPTAGVAGRRALVNLPSLNTGDVFAPGSTVGVYLWLVQAYVPVALEFISLRPTWLYFAKAHT